MEDQFQPVKAEAESINVKDLFFKYVRFLPLIIITMALSLFVAYLYLRYATPVYQSSGSFVINGDNSSGGGGNDRFQQLFGGGKKDVGNELEVLKSRPLIERVVNNLHLNFTQFLKGKIKDENRYNTSFKIEALAVTDSNSSFSMKINFTSLKGFEVDEGKNLILLGQGFKNQHGTFRITGNPLALVGKEFRIAWKSTGAVVSEVINNLVVAAKGTTGIIILLQEAENPKLAADLINQLVIEYQKSTIEDKNETIEQTIKFIDDRLRIISREVDSVTGRLLAYQKANNLINSDAQSSQFFNSSTEVDVQINQQQIQSSVAQMLDICRAPAVRFLRRPVFASVLRLGE